VDISLGRSDDAAVVEIVDKGPDMAREQRDRKHEQ